MDDLEFRKRAYSNPFDDAADFLEASQASALRSRLVSELRQLDQHLNTVVKAVAAPAGLAEQLKQGISSLAAQATNGQATNAQAAASSAASQKAPPPETATIPAARPAMGPRRFAMAASLVVAVALGFSLLPAYGPDAQDLEFHDQLLSHVYLEEPRFENGQDVSWQDINNVVASAGGRLQEDGRLRALAVQFASICDLSPQRNGAHIVFSGSQGAVSIFLVRGSPVSSEFKVRDERFAGRVIPLQDGNLVIISEKDEPLDDFQSLITDNFEWQI